VQTDASAVGDVNDAVVKRISKFWQAAIAAESGSVDFRGALHVQGLMGPLVVDLFEKIIKFALLPRVLPTPKPSAARLSMAFLSKRSFTFHMAKSE